MVQGLVEKWLKEVQTIMLESMLTQTRMAYDSYWNAVRRDWMTKWPGQIVQTVTRMTWTKDVSQTLVYIVHYPIYELPGTRFCVMISLLSKSI